MDTPTSIVAPVRPRIRYGGVIAGQEEIDAVTEVLRSDSWACGPKVAEFEEAAAKFQGRKHALFVNSGSSALLAALSTLPHGSRVAMPALQFPTAYAAAVWCGLEPVLVDIDNSLNMDPERLAREADLDAVLFVHIAGNPTNVVAVRDLCDDRGLLLIEDNCEGFGGAYGETRVGNFGAISCTSTHAAHQIATGEGGLVFTDDTDTFMQMKRVRDWGRAYGAAVIPGYYENYTFSEFGLNLRNSDIAAAIGLVQLAKLDRFTFIRNLNYTYLRGRLDHLPIDLPRTEALKTASWYTFPLLCDDRDALRAHLDVRGIETRTILTGNLARQPMAQDEGLAPEDFPVAEDVMARGLWFSCHAKLSVDDLDHIIASVREFYA